MSNGYNMKNCKKCNAEFPNWAWVEGKYRNFRGRKYCFDCSPFGKHNTRQLEKQTTKKCQRCERYFSTKGQTLCGTCQYRKRRNARMNRIYDIVGTKCWHCDYDKGILGRGVLEFHHIDPNEKLFNLSAQQYAMRRWELVFTEMRKRAVLCCRCHREQHLGLIAEKEIWANYNSNWDRIMARGPVSDSVS